MPGPELDPLDHAILHRLQADCRTTAEALGAQVGLSAAAVQRRIKRMREAGVIDKEVAIVEPQAVGVQMTFLVLVEMERERIEVLDAFRKQALADPCVQQCYYVTGSADFALVVLCRDMTAFDAFTRRMFFDNDEVRHFTTSVVLDRVKVGLTVPLNGG